MRRTVTFITLVALMATFIVPAAVFAKGPPQGKGPSSVPPGLEKKADSGVADSVVEEADEGRQQGPPAHVIEKQADKQQERAEKAERKAERAADRASERATERTRDHASESAQVRSEEETEAVEGTGPIQEQKRTGVENALSRILANIERAEARVAAGTQSRVPPGLLRVAAKFLGWLGVDGDDGSDPHDPGDEGSSDEETGTVPPPDGSDEETMTIDPE